VDAPGDVTGSYVFRLLDFAAAPALTPGTPVSGDLTLANETDLYRFEAAGGDATSSRMARATRSMVAIGTTTMGMIGEIKNHHEDSRHDWISDPEACRSNTPVSCSKPWVKDFLGADRSSKERVDGSYLTRRSVHCREANRRNRYRERQESSSGSDYNVILSPFAAKRRAALLKGVIHQYETRFGVMDLSAGQAEKPAGK
jgi:hypothetical protein